MHDDTFLTAVALAGALLATTPAVGQEEGGGDTGGGDFSFDSDIELDHSGTENVPFDHEAYSAAESTLHVGELPSGKGYSSYLHMGTVQLGGPTATGYATMAVPTHYVVQPGDTLMDISARFFGNPDLWPEIWSLNPDITNPNWIYPGQAILLVKETDRPEVEQGPVKPKIVFAAKWKPGTVIYRNPGFVDKEIEEASGEIVGSFHETKYLSHLDSVYIKYAEGKAPAVGATATVYRIEREVKDPEEKKKTHGKLVDILGTVKVTSVDEEHRIAKATITESLDVIERGDLVGPMRWKLAVVTPLDASLDLEGRVIASHSPINNVGAGHIVFIDLGYEDGVIEGNRVYVMRKGDPYQASVGKKDADEHFPWETIGQAIVLESLKKTSTCLMVQSDWDVHVGDKVELRRGQ
jgi:hypothetical protein